MAEMKKGHDAKLEVQAAKIKESESQAYALQTRLDDREKQAQAEISELKKGQDSKHEAQTLKIKESETQFEALQAKLREREH